MEVFGMIGFPLAIFAFIIAITNQNKCSKLEKQLKKLKRKTKGDTSMSRLIKNLVGQKAFVITADEARLSGRCSMLMRSGFIYLVVIKKGILLRNTFRLMK